MRSIFSYTMARVLLLAATTGVLYLFGARGFLLAALAVLISGLISLVLLSPQRDAFSSALLSGVAAGRRKIEESAAAEDPKPQPSAAAPADSAAGSADAEPAAVESGPGFATDSASGATSDAEARTKADS